MNKIKLAISFLALLSLVVVSALALASENLSLGKPYELIITEPVEAYREMATTSYPDVDSKELTDGVFAKGPDFKDAAWVGYLRQGAREIVIDLGAVANISEVAVSMLNASSVGIRLPSEFSVSLSDEGKLWSAPVRVRIHESFVDEVKSYSAKFNDAGRYVKVSVPLNVWVFIDEITVLGSK